MRLSERLSTLSLGSGPAEAPHVPGRETDEAGRDPMKHPQPAAPSRSRIALMVVLPAMRGISTRRSYGRPRTLRRRQIWLVHPTTTPTTAVDDDMVEVEDEADVGVDTNLANNGPGVVDWGGWAGSWDNWE